MHDLDIAIVGAGAAGIGMGCVLHDLGIPKERFALLDREGVGASFRRWPREMRFISPSFTSNPFGALDLNAIALGTSPAYTLGCEHPTGDQYADYLDAVVDHYELEVRDGIDVRRILPLSGGGFELETTQGKLTAASLIWAAGEFQYPRLKPFPGAELCQHTSMVESFRDLPGDDFLVIGGFESGIDAAWNLARTGRHVRVLDRRQRWKSDESDPSVTLSPYTRQRLRQARRSGRVELHGNVSVVRVEMNDGQYFVHSQDGDVWTSASPPLLANGFESSLGLVSEWFEWHEKGYPILTDHDESTLTPGLFLVGPQVRHEDIIFCFIYKFRQRFAVVAAALAERMGIDAEPLEAYRTAGMYLEDLSCCQESCEC